MSEENDKKIAGAITYPSQNENGQEAATPIDQPRQPTNLPGLLRYAMDATKAEDAPHKPHVAPLDHERKKFLENAFKSMTVDVIELLQDKIRVLQNSNMLNETSDVGQHVLAIETILDYVDHIDIANDFHKIGGFTIFIPCLKCVSVEIRAGACEIIAELCQNNPYCQQAVLDAGLIPTLVKLLAGDGDDAVCVKALYAISCVVRQHGECFQQFVQYEGLGVLLKCLRKNEERLVTKTTFLLSSLCTGHPDLMSRLVFLEYVPVLIELVGDDEREGGREHVLSLLLLLVTENGAAANECKQPKYEFDKVLRRRLTSFANKDECQEEADHCRQILKLLFSSSSSSH